MAPVDSDSSLSSDTDGVPLIDTRLKSVSVSNGAAKRARAVESEESELSSDDDGAPLVSNPPLCLYDTTPNIRGDLCFGERTAWT